MRAKFAERIRELPGTTALVEVLVLAVVFAIGAWLRFAALAGQTPFHDEWHTLAAVESLDLTEIFSSFGSADRSIPVTLFAEVLSRRDQLSDLALWPPLGILGLVAIGLLHVAAKETFGRLPAALLSVFLLLSPVFVYYSRAARPYALSGALAVASVLFFGHWLQSQRWRLALAWIISLLGVAWFMPVHVPFAIAPLIAASKSIASAEREARRHFMAVVLVMLLLLAALLAPPLVLDWYTLVGKTGSGELRAVAWWRGLTIGAGAGSNGILFLMIIGAVCESVRHNSNRFLRSLALAAGVQTFFILLTRPSELQAPLVTARYLLPASVTLVAVGCCGIARLARTSSSRVACAVTLPALLLVVTWVPMIPLLAGQPDNFRSTKLFHLLHFKPQALEAWFAKLPEPYTPIASQRGAFAIVEVPYNGMLRTPYGYYQRLHRREVYLGVQRGFCNDGDTLEAPAFGQSGFRLSRFVALADESRLRELGVRFVVFHRNPEAEIPWLDASSFRRKRFEFERCVRAFRDTYLIDPAMHADHAVFDMTGRLERKPLLDVDP